MSKDTKKADRETFTKCLTIGTVLNAHQASGKPVDTFTEETKAALRESLHAAIDRLVDDLEAFKFSSVAGKVGAGKNAIGQPRYVAVNMFDFQINSSLFELTLKAQAPDVDDESDIYVPPKGRVAIA